MPGVVDENTSILHINVIRLALHDDEAERLFVSFAQSTDPKIKQAGDEGITNIRNTQQTAAEKERDGFALILAGKFDEALSSFESAENISPTYHNVFEISQLLRRDRDNIRNEPTQKEIIRRLLRDYSWGMPEEVKAQLKAKL